LQQKLLWQGQQVTQTKTVKQEQNQLKRKQIKLQYAIQKKQKAQEALKRKTARETKTQCERQKLKVSINMLLKSLHKRKPIERRRNKKNFSGKNKLQDTSVRKESSSESWQKY